MSMRSGVITVLLSSIILTAFASMSEESILNNYSEMVFRPDSMTLCILTTEGDTLVFADTPYELRTDWFDVYSVISYLQEQDYYYWVIQIVGYEWIEWLLVNGRNGRTERTISVPILSPDGTRLLCAQADQVACFIENGIQIWRIDADSLVLEFSDLDVAWEPHHIEWINDSVIILDKVFYDWRSWNKKLLPGRLELSGDGTWIPDDPESWE